MRKITLLIFIFNLTFSQNSVVRQFSKAFADVAEKAKPAVVTIITDKVVSLNQFDDFGYFFFQPNMPRQREYKTNALGSGVIVDAANGAFSHLVKDLFLIQQNFIDNMGILFQGGALFDSLTVWQNIAFKLINNLLPTLINKIES